jgi:hypothetical protein
MSVTLSLSYILEHQKLEIIANTLGAENLGLHSIIRRSPPEGALVKYREYFDDQGRVYFRETLDAMALNSRRNAGGLPRTSHQKSWR